MSFIKNNSRLTIGLLVLVLLSLPASIFIIQKQLELRSRAEKTAVLSFNPASDETNNITAQAQSPFTLDIMINPGNNLVSTVKAEITYDATKLQPGRGLPFQLNQSAFSQLIEGPAFSPGKIIFTASVGTDLSKVIVQPTRVGSITFQAVDALTSTEGPTLVSFGTNTQILSISSNSASTENVVASMLPAYISLIAAPEPTCSPRPVCLDNTPACTTPEPSGGWCPAPTAMNTPIPTPTPTLNPASNLKPISRECKNAPSDSILVFDLSGSMSEKIEASRLTKLSAAKSAAKNYVNILAKDTQNYIGVVSFSTSATVKSPLTNNFTLIKQKIDALATGGWTCHECGILKANKEIADHGRQYKKKVVILLTDGRANHISGVSKTVDGVIAEDKALVAALAGHTANGTVFYTIGLGRNVNSAFLKKLATSTGGQYYFSPSTDQLNEIYAKVSQAIAKGSVNGYVFNDVNGNGALDQNEGKQEDWTLLLTQPGTNNGEVVVTDESGDYNFANLCDGNYAVKALPKNNWKQTVPADINGYDIAITNSTAITGKIFGNKAISRCIDGFDNDNNGVADIKDSTCHTDGNPNNPSSYDVNKDGEKGGGNTCADSKDNNGNNLIDGADPVCHTDNNAGNASSYDPNRPEANPPTNTPVPTNAPTSTPVPTDQPTVVPTSIVTAIPTTVLTEAPTAIPVSGSTLLSLNVKLHGIGTSGDNANPTASSFSNKSPVHTVQPATITIINSNNELVASFSGDLRYASESGSYTGTINAGTNLNTDSYLVKIKTPQHLTRLVAGIHTITSGQTNSIPVVDLVTGDITNDNQLDIRDYNALLDCYSDLYAAPACNADKKILADINDDDGVNQFDYNLFLREISTQPGE